MSRLLPLAVLVTVLVSGAEASAKVPVGYDDCGAYDFESRSWTYGDVEPGAFLVGFADGMSCEAARRNIRRVRYTKASGYRPSRPGYRCQEIVGGYEYSDVRCTKIGGTAKFRFQTGS